MLMSRIQEVTKRRNEAKKSLEELDREIIRLQAECPHEKRYHSIGDPLYPDGGYIQFTNQTFCADCGRLLMECVQKFSVPKQQDEPDVPAIKEMRQE